MLDAIDSGEPTFPSTTFWSAASPVRTTRSPRLLNQAHGIQGKKGVLWWQIHRLIEMSRPPMVFLENVDRLLKSPAHRSAGATSPIMLASLSDLGYVVEWRVINAADYGFPQRRRRVFIVAHRAGALTDANGAGLLYLNGVLARAFSVAQPPDDGLFDRTASPDLHLGGDLVALTGHSTSGAAARRSRTAAS